MCDVPLSYGFIIENDDTPYIIENDIFLIYSNIIKNIDSDRWLKTMKPEMDSLYINQVWILVEAPMSATQ